MILTSKYNKIILSGLMIVLSFLMVAQVALAETPKEIKAGNYGLNKTAEGGFGAQITKSDTNLSSIIGKIVGAALAFLGVAFFILIIIGGYMWMFSMGNEQTATKAKDILIAAVIGLIIVLAAYAITIMLASIFPDITGIRTE